MRPDPPHVIANRIRMKRSRFTGTIILVEGVDDSRFFERFFAPKVTKILPGGNKDSVCDAIGILDSENYPGVLGLIDADFDHIENRYFSSPNLISSDFHDLECMQLNSSVLDVVVRELGSRQKLRKFDRNLQEVLLELAIPVGCLRLFSERRGLSLKFRELEYSNFINKDDLQIDRKALVSYIRRRSERLDLSEDYLLGGLAEIESKSYESWQICSGKDLLGILSVALRKKIGTRNSSEVDLKNLQQAFRLSYGLQEFTDTNFFQSLRRWEMSNQGYRIL